MAAGKFVAYYRVSTQKQGASGLGLEAQQKAVADYLNGGDWELLADYSETESGKRHDNRPQLSAALEVCRRQKATLVIAKLDRLTRNATFLSSLLDSGVKFVAVDNPHANPLTIRILAAVAQEEREQISKRTKAALAAAKARGKALGWAMPSRQQEQEQAAQRGAAANKARANQFAANALPVVESIRKAGITSLHGIAKALNDRGVATARGGRWYAATVRNLSAHQAA